MMLHSSTLLNWVGREALGIPTRLVFLDFNQLITAIVLRAQHQLETSVENDSNQRIGAKQRWQH